MRIIMNSFDVTTERRPMTKDLAAATGTMMGPLSFVYSLDMRIEMAPSFETRRTQLTAELAYRSGAGS